MRSQCASFHSASTFASTGCTGVAGTERVSSVFVDLIRRVCEQNATAIVSRPSGSALGS